MERSNKKGFTIFEILIVIFLIGVLSAILFFAFNSLDVIKRARDSKRINDLQALNSAIQILINQNPYVFLGEENIIYLSLPDTNSNCSTYLSKLPPLYSPFSYRCVNSNDFRKINGQGWLPLNFSNLLLGISSLPIDPLNNSDYFYAYTKKGNKYKLTARMESENFALMMVNDGGIEPLLYEIGSDLKIPNPQSGLVLYLPFEEGTGTRTYDLSGYNSNGTLYNFNFNSSSGWVKGKSGWGLIFDGVDDYILIPTSTSLDFRNKDFTISVWIFRYNTTTIENRVISQNEGSSSTCSQINFAISSENMFKVDFYNCGYITPKTFLDKNNWYNLTYSNSNSSSDFDKIFVNGLKENEGILGNYIGNPSSLKLSVDWVLYQYQGIIDELRIYSRKINDLEAKLIYYYAK